MDCIVTFRSDQGSCHFLHANRVFQELGRVADIIHERTTTECADYKLARNIGS
jgi:hypothetical protein